MFGISILMAIIFHFMPVCGYVDLEQKNQDLVLEIKKIDVPGHPEAFNPSIVRWENHLIMSFRVIINTDYFPISAFNSSGESKIGLVLLDEEFSPANNAQLLTFSSSLSCISREEDARLLTVGDRLYIIYSNNVYNEPNEGGFRMHIAELTLHNGIFQICNEVRLSYFDGASASRREKNWVPFDYLGNLLLAYSLLPHRIFYPIAETQYCENVGLSTGNISWPWGELRGGTPGILVDDEYVAFFHSQMDMRSLHSNGSKTAHYFMGAYTFSSEPPFPITKISSEPIIAKGFYSGSTYIPFWKPVNVVFPCGVLAQGPYLYVTYGRQDHEIWIAKFDKNRLLESLIPVQSVFPTISSNSDEF